MEFRVVIPARYRSTRFPGKVLADIAGKPMVQRVYEHALASGAESVVIATDDKRVSEVAEGFGAQVCMTAEDHESGTERLAEAVVALEYDDDDIVVNVQADMPLVPAKSILQVAQDLSEHDNVKVATLCSPIEKVEDLFDRNVVKAVLNHRGYAMYFSRAVIPWDRDHFNGSQKVEHLDETHLRHSGLFAYRVKYLQRYVELPSSPLENIEKLEQLRILWHGDRIHVGIAEKALPPEVNTQEDLDKLLEYMQLMKIK